MERLSQGQIQVPSAGARSQWAGGERTGPHAEAAERRRNVAEKIPAARAAAIVGDRARDVHAQPMAAGFAQWINALHGQAGQVLHSFTSVAAKPGQPRRRHALIAAQRNRPGPLAALLLAAVPRRRTLGPRIRSSGQGQGPRGNSELDGAHSALNNSGCQEENTTRYCGKVAAVKNVVFVPQTVCGPKTRYPSRECRQQLGKAPGNRAAHFYVVRNEGGAASLQLRQAARRRKKCRIQQDLYSVAEVCPPCRI